MAKRFLNRETDLDLDLVDLVLDVCKTFTQPPRHEMTGIRRHV